ncbi:hypothetical protein [Parafilimonas sp.]|uniref:hypothetical protein n=1 Tax=Parafilimonas sp. TaxID=1969739 RepID=UPI0039E4411E
MLLHVYLKTNNDSITERAERYQKTMQQINKAYRGTIYFQVSSSYRPQALTDCMNALRDTGFIVPAAETIDKPFKNIVKYFHGTDSAIAKEVQDVCRKYYPQDSLALQKVRLKSNKVSPGTIEAWINK